MATSARITRRRLLVGAVTLPLAALCALLLRSPDDERPSPAEQRPGAVAPAERAARAPLPRGHGKSTAQAPGEELDEEEAPAQESRRDEYTAAFNRKLDRVKQRLAEDCSDDEFLSRALDDFDAVRDRIVSSALATDQGLKTREEQRDYEHRQLLDFDTTLCLEVQRRAPAERCRRNFHACDHILAERPALSAH